MSIYFPTAPRKPSRIFDVEVFVDKFRCTKLLIGFKNIFDPQTVCSSKVSRYDTANHDQILTLNSNW